MVWRGWQTSWRRSTSRWNRASSYWVARSLQPWKRTQAIRSWSTTVHWAPLRRGLFKWASGAQAPTQNWPARPVSYETQISTDKHLWGSTVESGGGVGLRAIAIMRV